MSEINYNINLDYDPENEELAVILNNADNFCNALELADIYFDSIKICIDSPKHYRICKREAPLKITGMKTMRRNFSMQIPVGKKKMMMMTNSISILIVTALMILNGKIK